MKVPSKNKKVVINKAEGGTLTPDKPFVKQPRKYKDDIGSIATDALLASIDNPLSTIGLGNIIKSDDYQSSLGAKTMNQVNNGVQEIGPGVAGAILNYYVPGLGSVVMAGTDAAKGATGPDEGLNASDSAIQASVGLGIRSIGGSMGGSKSNQSGIIGSLDKMINNTSTDKGTTTNVNANPNTIVASPTAIQNETESGTKKKVLMGKNGLYEEENKSKGGQIKGPGTTTSDSIKDADVEEGGFIVPAKNKEVAMLLRARYLSGSPTKTANV